MASPVPGQRRKRDREWMLVLNGGYLLGVVTGKGYGSASIGEV